MHHDDPERDFDDIEESEGDRKPPAPRRALSSDKFRYKLLRGPWNTPGDFVRLLNNFGKEGWEAMHIHYEDGRPKEVMLKLWIDEDAA